MKTLVLILLCFSIPSLTFAQRNGFNVRYRGGSVETKSNKYHWDNKLTILSDQILLELKDGQKIEKEVVPVADVFSYIFDGGRLQGKDLKNLLKDFAITHDNDLNTATYGVKATELLSGFDGRNVGQVPAEIAVFSETIARFFARE